MAKVKKVQKSLDCILYVFVSPLEPGIQGMFDESESCFVQPKPRSLGREPTIYDKEKESLPPGEKLKIPAVSTTNGVKSLHEQPLAKDAADPPGSAEKTQPLQGPKESGPLLQGGKDDNPEAEEQKDLEAVTEVQPLEGNAETEPLGTEAKHQPLRTAVERDSLGVGGDAEIPQTARKMNPLRMAEKIPPLEAGREPQPQEAMGKPQLLETVPPETESPEILEGSQLVKTTDQHQLQETLGRGEQSQLLEAMPKEEGFLETPEGSQLLETAEKQQLQETFPKKNGCLEIPDGSQLVEMAVKNDLIHESPEGPGNMEQSQPEGVIGSGEHPTGILETGTNTEFVRKIHSNKENQHIEGETGEKVETETEKVSEGAETKEEETGEAVDLSAAT
ncbi:glutamate-rich protein 5 isoform X1 [Saccopteryx leptura]|uniref:glutamate-rich protein 5 isoform X1 n=2 Tax=Saccopteryx leptura TaxID=249018 RepID=UPI00339C8057